MPIEAAPRCNADALNAGRISGLHPVILSGSSGHRGQEHCFMARDKLVLENVASAQRYIEPFGNVLKQARDY